jgi:hypothetical protein
MEEHVEMKDDEDSMRMLDHVLTEVECDFVTGNEFVGQNDFVSLLPSKMLELLMKDSDSESDRMSRFVCVLLVFTSIYSICVSWKCINCYRVSTQKKPFLRMST